MLNFVVISICLIVASLGIFLLSKVHKLKEKDNQIETLKASLEEMDEQAKLIMRTDMELNKTQEELDKKISGLDILQRLSRDISTTLEEKQIFRKINNEYFKEVMLSMSKALDSL